MRAFRDYRPEAHRWITIFGSSYYPDSLADAAIVYEPYLARFAELLAAAASSEDLLRSIQCEPQTLRIQLLRIFRKYVSPDTSVEMLKQKRRTESIIEHFGSRFRPLEDVREWHASRALIDEALIAVLDEYRERGSKGYDLTEALFAWFDTSEFARAGWKINGPVRAGRDLSLSELLEDYPVSTPVDFVISDTDEVIRIVGFARYDSDRGGAQEDDRTSGNARRQREILEYADDNWLPLRVVFLNDGPGLLLGSMRNDYSAIEEIDPKRTLVATLRMITDDGRLTLDWLTA